MSDILVAPRRPSTKPFKTLCSEARVIRLTIPTTTAEPIELPPALPPVQLATTKGKGKAKGKAKFIPPPPGRIPESVKRV